MKKFLIILNLVVISLLISYGIFFFFPKLLFHNSLEYKSFVVYFHSENTNPDDLKFVLDKSLKLLSRSELFDKEASQKLFLCSGFKEFTFFAFRSRKAFGVNSTLTNRIFLSKSQISKDIILRNGADNNKRTLSGIIAHETMHSLLNKKLGVINYRVLPTWKNEGYCDFIAQESSFDMQSGLNEICKNNENVKSNSFNYFKYKLYVDYLFEQGVTLDMLLSNTFDLEKLNRNIQEKYCNKIK